MKASGRQWEVVVERDRSQGHAWSADAGVPVGGRLPACPRDRWTTPPARVALDEVRDALGEARSELLAACEVGWVSSAADRYRALLADALGDLARLGVATAGAYAPVLRHTAASDAQRETVEATTLSVRR